MPLSVRVTNVLMHNGIRTVADLFRMKIEDFIHLRGAGVKCYDETCRYLADLSSKVVEFNVSSVEEKTDSTVSRIVIDHIDSILNQDFSFLYGQSLENQDITIIEKYRESIEILGSDLARMCYATPNRVLPFITALKPIIKPQQEYVYKRKQNSDCLTAIPAPRRSKYVYGYICAFTFEEEQRQTLYQIYSSDNP